MLHMIHHCFECGEIIVPKYFTVSLFLGVLQVLGLFKSFCCGLYKTICQIDPSFVDSEKEKHVMLEQ